MTAQQRLDFLEQRDRALTRPCPHCEAPTGEPCRNAVTGEPVVHLPAHPKRLGDAR